MRTASAIFFPIGKTKTLSLPSDRYSVSVSPSFRATLALTALTIDKGQKNTRLLVQPQYSPMPVEQQIAVLYCGTHGLLKDVPLDKVQEFEKALINNLQQTDVFPTLKKGIIDDAVSAKIEEVAAAVASVYKKS